VTNHITPLGDAQVPRRIRLLFADVSRPIAIYMVSVGLVSGTLAGAFAYARVSLGPLIAVGALAVVAAVSEWRGRIDLRGRRTALFVSISLFPSVFAAVLFGPFAGMAVFSASALGCRIPLAGRITYVFNRALVGAAAGGAAAVAVALLPSGPGEILVAATVATAVGELADTALTATVYSLRGMGRWVEPVRELLPVVVASVPFYGPVVAVLVLA
jgi:hypothetical protein